MPVSITCCTDHGHEARGILVLLGAVLSDLGAYHQQAHGAQLQLVAGMQRRRLARLLVEQHTIGRAEVLEMQSALLEIELAVPPRQLLITGEAQFAITGTSQRQRGIDRILAALTLALEHLQGPAARSSARCC